MNTQKISQRHHFCARPLPLRANNTCRVSLPLVQPDHVACAPRHTDLMSRINSAENYCLWCAPGISKRSSAHRRWRRLRRKIDQFITLLLLALSRRRGDGYGGDNSNSSFSLENKWYFLCVAASATEAASGGEFDVLEANPSDVGFYTPVLLGVGRRARPMCLCTVAHVSMCGCVL